MTCPVPPPPTPEASDHHPRAYFWSRYVAPPKRVTRSSSDASSSDASLVAIPVPASIVAPPAGEHLAAMRRGADREPGSVPAMWPYYTRLDERGRLTRELRAEHHALVLFGFHHQSARESLHLETIPLAAALGRLRIVDDGSREALDRRFYAAVTTDDVDQLAHHLRSFVARLRKHHLGFDYAMLTRHLSNWHDPDRRHAVRRRWAGAYNAPVYAVADGDESTDSDN